MSFHYSDNDILLTQIISDYSKKHNIHAYTNLLVEANCELDINKKEKLWANIVEAHVLKDKNLTPLVLSNLKSEFYEIFDLLSIIDDMSTFNEISYVDVLKNILNNHIEYIEKDEYLKYQWYRKTNEHFSPKDKKKWSAFFEDIKSPVNPKVEPVKIKTIAYPVEELEFLRHLSEEEALNGPYILIDQFLKPIIKDYSILNKLGVSKITEMPNTNLLVFLGYKNQQYIERFVQELPNMFAISHRPIGNSKGFYSDHKEEIYKYVDHILLDEQLPTKNESRKKIKI
jgi:hypothetical protein